MDIIYLLIPIAIILVGFGTWAFFWSVNSGQFDDLESPAHRILYDDDDDMIPDDAKLTSAKAESSSQSAEALKSEAGEAAAEDRKTP